MPQRMTIADLLDMRGKRALSMLRVTNLEEAEAAQKAGVDMLSVPPSLIGPAFREAAPRSSSRFGLGPTTSIKPSCSAVGHLTILDVG